MADRPEKPRFAWLHVSDIHLGHGTTSWKYDQKEVLEELVADIPAALADAGLSQLDLVICTGDVAATGALKVEAEYEEAEALIESLKSKSGADRFVSVQGNHDVQRTELQSKGPFRLLRDLRNGEESVDDAAGYERDRADLAARFANFNTFLDRLGAPRAEDGIGAWQTVLEVGELRVRIAGLNTALLCNDDNDERHLRVGRAQLATAFAESEAVDLTLVLGHHPLNWLDGRDGKGLETRLFRAADAYLHGHLHDPQSVTAIKGTGQQLTTITAGAVHGEESEPERHAYSLGVLMEADDGSRSIRVWPRVWDQGRRAFIADSQQLPSGQRSAKHPLRPAEKRDPAAEEGPPIRRLSTKLLARTGKRRTAFPRDLSLAELRAQGLAIETRLLGGDRSEATSATAAEWLSSGRNVLALGPPGSGKTMLAFQVASALHEAGALPLMVDLRSLGEGRPATVEQLTALIAGVKIGAGGSRVICLVDGIDEAFAAGIDPELVAAQLTALSSLDGLFVTCRDNDFERRLAGVLPDSLFDTICTLQPWRVDDEFGQYIEKLVETGRLRDESLRDAVENDGDLQRLVERPLLARMLAFVAEDGGLTPAEPAALYGDYLGKLAAAAKTTLTGAGCEGIEPLRLWREVAWHVFSNGLPADSVPIERLLGEVGGEGVSAECVYRALGPILDLEVDRASTKAAFSHYSFFEFLLAQEVAERLIAANAAGDLESAAAALRRDLPQEVRRHLVEQLRAAVIDAFGWPGWLAAVYRNASGSAEQVRTVRNLIAYLACRGRAQAAEQLRELLAVEDDPFLRNSLMWALAREGELLELERYLGELGEDEELASLNRGYLLYYFGDLPRGDPPFPDGGGSWSKTRGRLLERFAGGDLYGETPIPRQALDLFTFYDFAAVRGERLSSTESETLDDLEGRIAGELPAPVARALAAKHDQVRAH